MFGIASSIAKSIQSSQLAKQFQESVSFADSVHDLKAMFGSEFLRTLLPPKISLRFLHELHQS